MVKVGWIWMGADLLKDLEGCSTAKLPGVEYVGEGDCSEALKSFGQKGDRSGGSPGIVIGGIEVAYMIVVGYSGWRRVVGMD